MLNQLFLLWLRIYVVWIRVGVGYQYNSPLNVFIVRTDKTVAFNVWMIELFMVHVISYETCFSDTNRVF